MAVLTSEKKRTLSQMQDEFRGSGTQSPVSTTALPPTLNDTARAWDVPESNGCGTLLTRTVSFDSNVSIILVGIRGVGKSSLGVLAATAYNRNLVDSDRVFLEKTGVSPAAYRRQHGPEAFRSRHRNTFSSMLSEHDTGSVIICSFADLEQSGSGLLAEYSRKHPVIHISRDAVGIGNHLRGWRQEHISEILRLSGPILRRCSNYEFFNLSEQSQSVRHRSDINTTQTCSHAYVGPTLTLKRVERDFIRLLRSAIGDTGRSLSHHSVYPLSSVPVEKREHTFATTLTVSEVNSGLIDLEKAQQGADCIELIVDQAQQSDDLEDVLLNIAQSFATVRRSSILPIILTAFIVGKDRDNDHSTALIQYCLRLGPDYCTVDLGLDEDELIELINLKGSSKIIGSVHDDSCCKSSQNLRYTRYHDKAVRTGCDIVKITSAAPKMPSLSHIVSLRQSVQGLKLLPVIAYEIGPRGTLSKCFNSVLTPVKCTEANSPDFARTDGAVSAKELTKALFATFILDPMHFLIYGANVSYSLSPAMHNAAYKVCGMPHVFEACSSESLAQLHNIMRRLDFGGAAITQPFKTSIVSLLDGLSSHADAIGAVNTVIPIRMLNEDEGIPSDIELANQRCRGGEVLALYGYNTDWIGIRACIRKSLSPANTIRSQTCGLVCGAGGMARAGIYALISLGVQNIFLYNRTYEAANTLARHFNNLIQAGAMSQIDVEKLVNTRVRVLETLNMEWPSSFRPPTIIVSCIPILSPAGDAIDFILPPDWLKSSTGGVVLEVAYARQNTPLTTQIRRLARLEWICLDGYDVLPEQAYSQFELFTGRRAPRQVMRDEVIRDRSASVGKAKA